jgi:hypothetical protein
MKKKILRIFEPPPLIKEDKILHLIAFYVPLFERGCHEVTGDFFFPIQILRLIAFGTSFDKRGQQLSLTRNRLLDISPP